eukprot:Skav210345  [mRNA]  locus=scaffold4443:152596:155394:- [translate_table: standard]
MHARDTATNKKDQEGREKRRQEEEKKAPTKTKGDEKQEEERRTRHTGRQEDARRYKKKRRAITEARDRNGDKKAKGKRKRRGRGGHNHRQQEGRIRKARRQWETRPWEGGCIHKRTLEVPQGDKKERFSFSTESPIELNVPKVVWIEAQEECRKPLEEALQKHGRQQDVVAITAISSYFACESCLLVNSESLTGHGHKSYFPFIQQAEVQDIQTETLNGLFQRLGLKPQDFDFLYLDVQGSELDVLHGSEEVLPHVRYIMTEISSEEHYRGGCTEKDLHAFLITHGFTLLRRQMPPIGHGNAFYAR